MSEQPEPGTCLVIGAGIAGLLAAQRLQAAGVTVTVLDKGRGVGGRMATRRFGTGVFDHGAQFFTARDPEFAGLVARWQAAGVAEVWSHGFADPETGEARIDGHPRFRGAAGMTSLPKYLARAVTVETGVQVATATDENGTWLVRAVDGREYRADMLLLTPPVPQSLALLDAGGVRLPAPIREALEAVVYAPCIAVLAAMTEASALPEPGGLPLEAEPLFWIADNAKKGITQREGSVTLHAGSEFSRQRWQESDATLVETLCRQADRWLRGEIVEAQVHRWRYARLERTHPERCLLVDGPVPLAFAGDAFAGPRVEGAALSGLAAADRLLCLRS